LGSYFYLEKKTRPKQRVSTISANKPESRAGEKGNGKWGQRTIESVMEALKY
jgi:hypothetical protein